MKNSSTLAIAALLATALADPAFAAARAWVSSTGTDSGICLVATPCRTFQYAHDRVDPGGEIDVKDAGGYGSINITKSISVVADGVLATLSGPGGGYAVNVLNTTASDVVLLRGLTINGSDMSGGGGFTIGTWKVTIDHCSVKGVGMGVLVQGTAAVMITNSLFTGNSYGLYISSASFTGVGSNIIVNNSTGVFNVSSSAFSYGDNKINGNQDRDFYPGALSISSMR